MKFISWNVNGLRAADNKGFRDIFRNFDADFFCVQETKLREGQIDMCFDGYRSWWDYADRPGYSGTAIFARHEPLSVGRGIGIERHDHEGRAVTLEYPGFYLVCTYTPNSQDGLLRLPYRMDWEDSFLKYVKELDGRKPVVICGDLNVAHNEIDLANPGSNHKNAGFSDEERAAFTRLLDAGFVDTFRYLHPEIKGAYSWWSYRGRAREKNVGWRIDYFVVSRRLSDRIKTAEIHSDIYGSDHCPVELTLD